MTTANIINIICLIINFACLAYIMRDLRRADRLHEAIKQDLDNATDAYEKAHLLMQFINAYKECRTEDQIADCLIVWVPILEAHGIAVDREEED